MRSFVPHTAQERADMLEAIGHGEDWLFSKIPEEVMLKRPLDLPEGKSELEVTRLFEALSAQNAPAMPCFRGAGAYKHFIPASVPFIMQKSEFLTAYTPYQPEMSQGMLQAIFEYQSMICELTGMDASNASVYDGATAAAEAMLIARDSKRSKKMLVSAAMHPDTRAVMQTYANSLGLELVDIPVQNGATDLDELKKALSGAAGVFIQQPNYFGCIEDIESAINLAHEAGALVCVSQNPISLGVLKRPGDLGADIAVGDGQPLGLPLSFGGPYVGFMAVKAKHIRNLPGRIVGETVDDTGTRAFVLTLQAREQHIRREKASSNICSNQALCALAASAYLTLMGPQGLADAANQCISKAHYLYDRLTAIKGFKAAHSAEFFNEFVLLSEDDEEAVNARVRKAGIIGGHVLSRSIPGMRGILFCATEMNTKEDIDRLAEVLEGRA